MYDNGFQFLTNYELDYFEELFDEKKQEKTDQIAFTEFKDIVMNYKNFNRLVAGDICDKIRRKLRDRQSVLASESEIVISN